MNTDKTNSSLNVFLVGGAVRDQLLNVEVKERDYLVVGSTVEHMLSLGFTQVGKDFPVFLHPKTKEEYALARTERKQGKGYTGFVCHAAPDVTIEQDLLRRDLTVNAMAMDNEGNIVDPYGGLADIKAKVLRHVSNAFLEDPLRVLRVARFAARYHHLGFTIADETLSLMTQISESGELAALSSERVWQECRRALSGQNPHVFFRVLLKCHALKAIWPNLITQQSSNNNFAALEKVSLIDQTLQARTIALCLATQGYNQAIFSSDAKHLKIPKQITQMVIKTLAHINEIIHAHTLSAKNVLTLLNQLDVWRKPQETTEILSALTSYARATSQLPSLPTASELLTNVIKACQQVTAQTFIAQGITGKDIKEAMERKRCEIIATLLLDNSSYTN